MKRKTPGYLDVVAPPSKAQRKLEAARMIQEYKREQAKTTEDAAETDRQALLPRDANTQTQATTVLTVDAAVQISTFAASKSQQTMKVAGSSKASQSKHTHGIDKATDSQGLLKFRSMGIQHNVNDNIDTFPHIFEEDNDEENDPTYKLPRTSSDSTRRHIVKRN